MLTDSQMNSSNSSSHLSLIYPEDTEHPATPVSNMPFNESIEFYTSHYISSEVIDKISELEECKRFGKEDFNVYKLDCLPPIPPTKEEEEDLVNKIEDRTYKCVIYANKMDMEAAMREDDKQINLIKKLTGNDIFYVRKFNEFKDKVGDGKMEYIKDRDTREMCTNAWAAITFSNNWDFVSEDVESFMWSNDPRIDQISEKMEEFGYDGHSGTSFGYTLRNMQYLVQNGEAEFKKLFDKSNKQTDRKFLNYCGGL